MKHLKHILISLSVLSAYATTVFGKPLPTEWNILVEQQGKHPLCIATITFSGNREIHISKKTDGFHLQFTAVPQKGYWSFKAEIKNISSDTRHYFASISARYTSEMTPYSFEGEVKNSCILRQSPHNNRDHRVFVRELPMQSLPVAALQSEQGFEAVISDCPAFYHNYTTQRFDIDKREIKVSSGDDGMKYHNGNFILNPDTVGRKEKGLYIIKKYYPEVTSSKSHALKGIYLSTDGKELGKLRQEIYLAVSDRWSGGKITDLLGSTFFGTAYMNMRVNDSGRPSRYWVVPSIEYSNKQYSRDAFWTSLILPDSLSMECYKNEAADNRTFIGAEKQLFAIIWAYINWQRGQKIDTSTVRKQVRIVEKQAPDGYFHALNPSFKSQGTFQGWMDLLAFDDDDAITANQGLFAVALKCAQRMGIPIRSSIKPVVDNYRNMFNKNIGAYSLSLKKDTVMAVDALMGDLLAQVFLGENLLPQEDVLSHYNKYTALARTKYGFKTYCKPDGSYCDPEQYFRKSYCPRETVRDGYYHFGGSWYLYDMLMLMDSYLHGAEGAEDLMIWRTKLEFERGNTTHEFINTKTGKAHKPNMAWNTAVYAIWKEIILQGKATERFVKEMNEFKL